MGDARGNNFGKFYSFLDKPVLLDLKFTVAATNGLGVTSVSGQGVKNVFMNTSTTPSRGPNNYLNPNPAAGFALIQLAYNYSRLYAGPINIRSPLAGSNIAINGSALTVGQPYVITDVGHGEAGTATIAPVADSAGSLASTWFKIFDNYGNTFVIWFSVSGVGVAPSVPGATLVQQSISANASAATIGAALVVTINAMLAATALNPSAPSGVYSFTASGTTTVTIVSTQQNPYQPLPGPPSDGVIPTGFTFAVTKYVANLQDWQAVGLPKGVVPAVNASFIATATGFSTGGGSTGLVKVPGVSAISSVEIVGDPNQSIGPIPMAGSPNVGSWIMLQFLGPTISTGDYIAPMIPTAPAAGSIVSMNMLLEQATRVGGNGE